MTDKTIYITEEDRIKLKKLVTYSGGYRFFDKKTLGELKIEIERAKVIKNKESIDGIITMNSKVRLKDLDSGLEFTYTLVYPDKANISENRISKFGRVFEDFRNDVFPDLRKSRRFFRNSVAQAEKTQCFFIIWL